MLSVATLLREYPMLDHTMAETLIRAHKRGVLEEMVKSWPDKDDEDKNKDIKENNEGQPVKNNLH